MELVDQLASIILPYNWAERGMVPNVKWTIFHYVTEAPVFPIQDKTVTLYLHGFDYNATASCSSGSLCMPTKGLCNVM